MLPPCKFPNQRSEIQLTMQRIPYVLDAVVLSISTASTVAANIMLANVPVEEINYYNELRLLLIPLIGAMLVSGGMIMLNPNPETRRIVIGRSIFALFVGVLAPQLLGFVHPFIQAFALKPVMMLAIGGASSGLAYAISRPFCSGLYARAERVSKNTQDALEAKFNQTLREATVEKHTITITEEKPKKPQITETTE